MMGVEYKESLKSPSSAVPSATSLNIPIMIGRSPSPRLIASALNYDQGVIYES